MSSGSHSTPREPIHKDGREVEWQLASTDLESVRRSLDDHGTIDGLVLEPRPTLKIFDTYFDTDDWRIHRAGFALRIRSESGRSEATLKSLHSNSTEMADRREVSETLAAAGSESIAQSTGPVGTRVHAVSGAHRLQPLFEVHTSRQRYAVLDDKQPLGEIALDETVISRPQGEAQTSIKRVEVEALTRRSRASADAGQSASARLLARVGVRQQVFARPEVCGPGTRAGTRVRANFDRCVHAY